MRIAAVVLAGLAAAGPARADVIIDSFAPGLYEVRIPLGGGNPARDSREDVAFAVGGYRYMEVNRTTGFSAVAGSVSELMAQTPPGTPPSPPTGFLRFESGASTIGNMRLVYDGQGGNTPVNRAGLGGVNLLAERGADRFEIEGRADQAGIMGQLQVWDLDNRTDTKSFTIPQLQPFAAGTVALRFDTFAGIDFTRVGAIELRLNTTGARTPISRSGGSPYPARRSPSRPRAPCSAWVPAASSSAGG